MARDHHQRRPACLRCPGRPGDPRCQVVLAKRAFPGAAVRLACGPGSQADADEMSEALTRLAAEDPSLLLAGWGFIKNVEPQGDQVFCWMNEGLPEVGKATRAAIKETGGGTSCALPHFLFCLYLRFCRTWDISISCAVASGKLDLATPA